MPQERRAQATYDRRTRLSATVCRAGSAVRRSGELERAPVVRRRRQDHQHVDAVISRIPPSRSIRRWRPGRWSHTGAKPPVPCACGRALFGLFYLFLFARRQLAPTGRKEKVGRRLKVIMLKKRQRATSARADLSTREQKTAAERSGSRNKKCKEHKIQRSRVKCQEEEVEEGREGIRRREPTRGSEILGVLHTMD